MARYPGATWRGPIPTENAGAAMGDIHLGIVHIMQGSLAGTDSWFHDPRAQVSAHFGIGATGEVYQWVDTEQVAYAESNFNGESISVEHEGYSGGTLTEAQQSALAALMAWIRDVHGVPLTRGTDPNGWGWFGHGELGVAGGNHPDCPGAPILAQLPGILTLAAGPPAPPAPTPAPPVLEEDKMFCTDPESGQLLITDAAGELFVPVPIPDLVVTTLTQHPDWHAGSADNPANPCVGITPWKDPSGAWGYAYVTRPAGGAPDGGVELYHIGRDGTPH